MTVAFPSSERKREGGEDGSNVSVESLESCRFSGFSLWLLSLLSSLCLSAMADCVICINESWRKEMVISFSVSFSFSISQSVILKDFIFLSLTSLLYSYNTPSLPLLSLSSSVSLPLLLSSRQTRIQPTRLLFIANNSSLVLCPPPPHHTPPALHEPPPASSCLLYPWLSNQCSTPPSLLLSLHWPASLIERKGGEEGEGGGLSPSLLLLLLPIFIHWVYMCLVS